MSTVSRLLRRHGVQSDVIGRGRERRRRPTRVIGLPPRKISSRPKDRRNWFARTVSCVLKSVSKSTRYSDSVKTQSQMSSDMWFYDDILDVVR